MSKAAIRALSSEDEIGILQWGFQGDQWVIPLGRVGDKARKCQLADGAEPSDMPSFDSSLELAADVRDAIARRASFNVIHLETMVKVDVFVAKDRPFDRRALERARPTAAEDACELPVASAEDTVLAKLEWYRRGGGVSERQWSDVTGLLRVRELDEPYLRQGALELGVADLLDRALEEAGRRREDP